jgi:two-component system sensor histidine kinase BaeS
LESFAARFSERRLSVEKQIATGLTAMADADRLAQAFRNLLENAARYTDPGGTVRVTARRNSGGVKIDLEDSAPGVPPEALPHLFERFYRVEGSRSRANGGAGLGLAIVRSVVEAHGGSIEAGASSLGGLRVTISLP